MPITNNRLQPFEHRKRKKMVGGFHKITPTIGEFFNIFRATTFTQHNGEFTRHGSPFLLRAGLAASAQHGCR